jgi:hypothetical protein
MCGRSNIEPIHSHFKASVSTTSSEVRLKRIWASLAPSRLFQIHRQPRQLSHHVHLECSGIVHGGALNIAQADLTVADLSVMPPEIVAGGLREVLNAYFYGNYNR